MMVASDQPVLPSLTALRTFEAAARHLNFTRAAAELDVGQPAVSRQISQLESELGVRLFVRRPNVRLTDAGRRLQDATSSAFQSIAQATFEISGVDERPEITVDVSIGFAASWLLPRLATFGQRHPDIAVRLVTRDLTTASSPDAEIVITFGAQPADPEAFLLIPELLFPVCSDRYPEHLRPHTIDDLVAAPLLGLAEASSADAWDRALGSVDRRAPVIPRDRRFNSFMVYAHAIKQQRGIGLAWAGLMDDDLDAGTLVRLTDLEYRSTRGYFVTKGRADSGRPGVQVFRDWLADCR